MCSGQRSWFSSFLVGHHNSKFVEEGIGNNSILKKFRVRDEIQNEEAKHNLNKTCLTQLQSRSTLQNEIKNITKVCFHLKSDQWLFLPTISTHVKQRGDKNVENHQCLKRTVWWRDFSPRSRNTVESFRQSTLSCCILRYMWHTSLMLYFVNSSEVKMATRQS